MKTSKPTATRDLQDLSDKEIVTREGGGRSTSYYIRYFLRNLNAFDSIECGGENILRSYFQYFSILSNNERAIFIAFKFY